LSDDAFPRVTCVDNGCPLGLKITANEATSESRGEKALMTNNGGTTLWVSIKKACFRLYKYREKVRKAYMIYLVDFREGPLRDGTVI
jgi:hypothetical protein